MASYTESRSITTYVEVEKHLIGLVIGSKHRTINKIQKDTGASVTLDPEKEGLFRVTGTKEQCEHAVGRIREIKPRGKQQPKGTKPFLNKKISFITSLDEVEPVRSSKYEGPTPVSWRKGGSSQTAKIGPVSVASYAESQSIITKYVRVENHLIGLVMGSNGRTIKEIQRDTGASVVMEEEGLFRVRGTKKQCEHAVGRIREIKPRCKQQPQGPKSSLCKKISFITSLDETDSVRFSKYEGPVPVSWRNRRNPVIYYLEAESKDTTNTQGTSIEHLRNYSKLESTVKESLSEILDKGLPVQIELEIRFGQVLWLSESKNAPSDEILFEKHRIKDLEKDGSVSVDGILGSTNWCFVTRLPDPDVLTSNLPSFPIVGEAEIIDISFTDGTQNPTRIRIRCTREPGNPKQVFELVEVGCRMTKDMTYDCLHLGSQLDVRVVLSHCDEADKKGEACYDWARKVVESLTVDNEMDGVNFHGYPPAFEPQFIRHVYQKKMYLMEHEGMQFILAHYQLTDRDCTGQSGPYQMGVSHEEFELWNAQWMADFAQLEKKDWREAFARNSCDVSKLKVQRRKVEIQTILEEMRKFTQLALVITT